MLEGSRNLAFVLLAPGGKVLARSPSTRFLPTDFPADGTDLTTITAEGTPYRVCRIVFFDGLTLEVARSIQPLEELLTTYVSVHLLVIFVMLLLGVVASWLLARRFISGVTRVSAVARVIAEEGNFRCRVPLGNDGSEIDELVRTFNLMNANTAHLFSELRMITDNVAHDLRTPLTRIRGFSEITVNGPPELSRYRELAAVVADECSQMIEVINTMLEIARTENSLEVSNVEPVDLTALLRLAYELFLPLAEERNITFTTSLPNSQQLFAGNRIQLQRIIANLLDNAFKFTPEKGTVRLSLRVAKFFYIIEVADSGCGIRQEEQQHIFERFYRGDASRSRPGNGLGLALVKAIVAAHRGSIELESSVGNGSSFSIRLPR